MSIHVVTLSNGRKIELKEGDNALTVAQLDSDGTSWYICQINANGVTVYPNSGTAPEYLTDNLTEEQRNYVSQNLINNLRRFLMYIVNFVTSTPLNVGTQYLLDDWQSALDAAIQMVVVQQSPDLLLWWK